MSEVLLPIVQVTLLEDRARVLRRGQVVLSRGESRVCVAPVAPVLVDKSLAARVIDSDAVRVVDARVIRRAVTQPAELPKSGRELFAQQVELERERAALTDRRAVLLAERDAVDALFKATLGEIADDAAWGRGDGDDWQAQLDMLSEREHKIIADLREIGFAERDLRERMERLGARRLAEESPATREVAEIELQLSADFDGVDEDAGDDASDGPGDGTRSVTIEIDYMVPGACWRPYHSASLIEADDGSHRVHLRCDGCVWQNTGEDWSDVTLRLSTQRLSLGASPPLLGEDRLDVQRRSSSVVVESREQAITTTGLGSAQSEAVVELPGIDDGGDAVLLTAKGSADVPSDGAPYRVLLFEFDSPAEVEHLVAAELAPAVIVRSEQRNEARHPLLAGPVDLIRSAGYSGRTSILYIAPGERFELGWGPDPELRVHRRDERLEDESRMLSAWTTQRHQISVRLSNIGDRHRTVHVKERVPVSEVEKVKISVDSKASTGSARPDADGFLDWQVDLAPFAHDTVTLRYEIKKHDDVYGL